MPTLRLQFPEKDSPSTLTLSGKRITIGRRADNTVQIVDRRISAFHAELILEGDHYRLHDLGSTNGTMVNGAPVEDYHLTEACKVGFGPVECEFSTETPAGEGESLPTRIEVDATRKENETLQARIAVLDEEVAGLRKLQEIAATAGSENLALLEIQRMIQERADLQEAAQKREREFAALKTELARMNRDRQNLQDALSQAQAELAHLREQGAAVKPVEPAKPVVATPPTATPATPAPTAASTSPATPAAPAKPVAVPVNLPKPTSTPAVPPPAAPAAPLPSPTAVPRPAAPAGQPGAPSAPGLRPVARPAVAAQAPSTPRAVAVPTAVAKPAAGPSGTQRIPTPVAAQAAQPSQPTRPLVKPTGLPKLGSLPKPTAVPASGATQPAE